MQLGTSLSLTRAGVLPWTPRRLFAAGEQGVWYDPSDLSTLFQDAAGTTPVTTVGQPVGLMRDKSGRGNHASQATTTARPLLQQDAGGRYYLSFDGVDDYLLAPIAGGFAALSMCAAYQFAAVKGGDICALADRASATTNRALGLTVYGGTSFPKATNVRVGSTGAGRGSNAITAGNSEVASGLWASTGNSGLPQLYRNGLEVTYANQVATTASVGGANTGLYIGGPTVYEGPAAQQNYGLIAIARKISSTERGLTERFLAARSGVTL